ncbi:hypothetical protein ACHQM5_011921 [Ranunculus cassubicifolius]
MASSSEDYKNKVSEFDGENYDFWCVRMRTLFISRDLLEYVEDGFKVPEDKTSLSSADATKLREHIKKDAKALLLIQEGVTKPIFPRIINATTSKEAWDILEREFRGSKQVKTVKLQSLRREFENLRMKDSELLKDYFTRFLDVVNQMKTYGEVIADQKVVEKILISLPERYDSIVSVIEQTKDLEKLGVEDLMGSIKAFEHRATMRGEKPLESAFQSKINLSTSSESSRGRGTTRGRGRNTRGRGRGRGDFARGRGDGTRKATEVSNKPRCGICQKTGHEDRDCWYRDEPQCYRCKKYGHIKKDCDQEGEQRAHYAEQNKQSGDQRGVEDHMFYAGQTDRGQQKSEVWYIDSGCSNHMTNNEEIFKEINTESHSKVKMGNGVPVDAKGKGTITVETKKGRKEVRDVLLVPDLAQNLLSIGQLLERGYVVHFDDLACKIYDQQRREIAKVKMKGNRSFPLIFNEVSPPDTSTSSEEGKRPVEIDSSDDEEEHIDEQPPRSPDSSTRQSPS